MNDDISLLDQIEVGSNVFELIEFTLERTLPDGTVMTGNYGVNVSKVREVVRMPDINPLVSKVKGIAGVFELRGIPIPAINVCSILGDLSPTIRDNQQIIVTEFSQKRAGFIVEQTKRIRRVEWDKVLPPTVDSESSISGMILIEGNKFLFILDLEKILVDIEISASGKGQDSPVNVYTPMSQVGDSIATPSVPVAPKKTGLAKLFLVDDSSLIRNNVRNALTDMGYDVTVAENGADAYAMLEEMNSNGNLVDLVISDVEMPKMDGLTLVRKIRECEGMANLPVILHTSLSGTANQSAGIKVGANGYVVKNNIKQLIEHISEILGTDSVPEVA